ncbi:hypothetical protein SAMN05421770_102203 [Granulicella rosea]|uniref:EamA-like transporter family protein n=1 Tax=Granulicella rosea TaxID=474952 RepID=A0A239H3I3_9BACT|nr:hypothetical protein [Granulicella rosea]SNS75751.1 hypothetical protein SAMN05421770_102203 [Granulicella rosea]
MRRRRWLGFAAFCLLTGSRWLLNPDGMALPVPVFLRTATHDVLLCALLCGWIAMRRPVVSWRTLPWGPIALCVAAIFVLPYAIIEAAGSSVTGFTETLVFTLVPVFVVFFVAQQDWEFGQRADPRRLLGPALAGVFGAALLIEFRWPSSVAGELWFGALVASAILASYAALRLHRALQGAPVVPVAALTGGIIAAAGIAVSWSDLPSIRMLDGRATLVEAAVALLLDGPVLLLSVWLLRELPPVAFSTRYLLFVVVTVVETYVVLHLPVVWRTGAGVLLMAGGAAWLLRESPTADSSNTSSP